MREFAPPGSAGFEESAPDGCAEPVLQVTDERRARGPTTSTMMKGAPRVAEAYCVKCKAKREMKNAQSITMKNGKPAAQGTCPVCGTKMFRIGG